MSEQLIKKNQAGGYNNVMPNSWIESIRDKSTGQTLTEILQGFNMYFLPYNGNTSSTRCLVPMILRKKGLWITYVKYDGNVYTEWYAADEIDDKSWGDSSNWRIGNNTLVGDITISANGNWVINGTETEFKAVGEKGNTPLIRVANNRLQVSYNLGETYLDVTDNPVYTKFRWLATTGDTQANNVGRIQASTDEGKTWTNMSNDFTNNLHIKKYIGVNESLPTSGIAEGTIYAKGPYYAEDDALNDNPIYRLWVYAWKDNTLAWQDNGEFTSIAAGVVQETGNSETEVMSQKATTEKLTELATEVSDINIQNNNLGNNTTHKDLELNYTKRYDNNYLLGGGNGLGAADGFYVQTYNINNYAGRKIQLSYKYSGSGILAYAFYSSDEISSETFISGSGTYTKELVIPKGASMLAVTIFNSPDECIINTINYTWVEFAKRKALDDANKNIDEIYSVISDSADYDTTTELSLYKKIDNSYILGSGAGYGNLEGFYVLEYDVKGYKKIHADFKKSGTGILYLAFYSSTTISSDTFISGFSTQNIENVISVPENAEIVSITTTDVNTAKVITYNVLSEYKVYDNNYLLINGSGLGVTDGFYVLSYLLDNVNKIHADFKKEGINILFVAFYSSYEISSNSYIKGISSTQFDDVLFVPENAKMIAITTTDKTTALVYDVVFKQTKFLKESDIKGYNINYWDKKTIGLIGDSITEICNGNPLPTDSWGYYISEYLNCNIISRGLGGSLMSYHIGETLYFDNKGNRVSEGNHVVSTDCWGMCMLERIKAQFPNTIKNDIDAVILMGGTNDKLLNRSIGDLSFIEHDSTDEEWSSSDMYCGGDFNINTYKGAVASAIMKLQAWMPNAVIILATPLSGDGEEYNSNSTEQWKNSNGETMQDFANASIEAAKYLSIPIIDINQKTGINPFNRNKYIYDNVHPYYDAGKKAMARVFIGELTSILPNI